MREEQIDDIVYIIDLSLRHNIQQVILGCQGGYLVLMISHVDRVWSSLLFGGDQPLLFFVAFYELELLEEVHLLDLLLDQIVLSALIPREWSREPSGQLPDIIVCHICIEVLLFSQFIWQIIVRVEQIMSQSMPLVDFQVDLRLGNVSVYLFQGCIELLSPLVFKHFLPQLYVHLL